MFKFLSLIKCFWQLVCLNQTPRCIYVICLLNLFRFPALFSLPCICWGICVTCPESFPHSGLHWLQPWGGGSVCLYPSLSCKLGVCIWRLSDSVCCLGQECFIDAPLLTTQVRRVIMSSSLSGHADQCVQVPSAHSLSSVHWSFQQPFISRHLPFYGLS